jgi:hypothetical protein
MVGRRSLIAFVLITLAVAASWAYAGSPNEEALPLLDAASYAQWQAEEATFTPGATAGQPAWSFHIKVDWSTGEPNYPIGWPRVARHPQGKLADWRGWEQIRYRVYAAGDRGVLPDNALALVVGTGEKGISWEQNADGLRPGEWREYAYDLSAVPLRERVRYVEFAIAESEYHDGESLDFWIDSLELVRYTRPTLMDLSLESHTLFADQKTFAFTVQLFGVRAGQTVPVQVSLQRTGKTVATQQVRAGEGLTPLALSIPRTVPPGAYQIVVRLGDQTLRGELTLVSSPWQEAK